MRLLIASLFAALLTGCPADDPNPVEVDSQAVCDCPAPTAATTTYDPTGSGLADSDVQGAIDELAAGYDELAARPLPPPNVFERIQIVNNSGSSGVVHAACPQGAKVIGGGCSLSHLSATLGASYPFSASQWTCVWYTPPDIDFEISCSVHAVCLLPEEQP